MDLSVIPVILYLIIFLPFLIILVFLPFYTLLSIFSISRKPTNSEEEKNQQQ